MFNTTKLGMVLVAALVAAPLAASAADAPAAFNACKACHKVEAGAKGVGPSLFGVFGRKSGTVDGFAYSEAMKTAALTWDEANLTKYISDPKATVPGNKMAFPGLKAKPDDAAAVVAYLKTLK
jgi:cytochrome c